MKLTANANFAMHMLFDEQGIMDEAFLLNAWPYSSMDEGEKQNLKSGLIELEAFGLVTTRNIIINGKRVIQKRLNRQVESEPLWANSIDSSIPLQ